MDNPPSTRQSLLLRIRDGRDERAWAEFMEIYEPLVYRLARRRGFQDADAADISQEVFRSAAAAIDRWYDNAQRGSFRAWLFLIARNLMINAFRARRRRPVATGSSDVCRLLDAQPASDDEDSKLVDEQCERRLFHWAVEQVRAEFRDSTWQAFWRTSVDGRPAKQVAEELRISTGAVYIARSRVMARLKKKIEEVEGRDE
ncbi:MAG TPA: RNA polymerase sigma factor [Pirellulales bacterium]|nr:RNA polymerase sigma factor [Pirellulales bacterium]